MNFARIAVVMGIGILAVSFAPAQERDTGSRGAPPLEGPDLHKPTGGVDASQAGPTDAQRAGTRDKVQGPKKPVLDPAARPAVSLVLDVSNSMWGQIEGRTKIDISREAIAKLMSEWNPNADLGLVAYGHRRPGDCGDIEILLPPGPLDPATFMARVNGLTPTGKTPLTQAVRKAVQDLSAQDRPATVILFSDGIETCGADPCALAAELSRAGVKFTAHIVGFSVAADEQRLSCLAQTTGGLYLSANSAPQLRQALRTVAALAANPAARDLVTLEASDEASGQPLEERVVWTVTSLGNEEPVSLTAGGSRPALPLAPGTYMAEARVGSAVGRMQFDVVRGKAHTVQVKVAGALAVAPPRAGTCAEPNDAFAEPAPVDVQSGVRDAVYPPGDADYCGLNAPGPGILTIGAGAAPEPIELVVRVSDVDRAAVRDWSGELLPGAALIEADLPAAGRYVLEVADSYNDAGSTDPYTLALSFRPAIDATEPNESLTRPARLLLDTPVQVAIFPKGDHNFLAVEVEEHGELAVRATGVPAAIDLAVRVHGPDLAVLRDWATTPVGTDHSFAVDLPAPGQYVLEIADSYDDARAPDPLTLTATFRPSVDPFEPNGNALQAAPLPFDKPVQATILPVRDRDVFAVETAHRGRLRVVAARPPAAIDPIMRVLDSDYRVVRDWAGAPARGADLIFEADLPAPGRYLIEVGDSYDDERSIEPLTLTASFVPAEDAAEPNDRPRDAKPLALGVPVKASILPLRDHDFFLIDVPRAAPLTVKASGIPADMDIALRLYDRNMTVVRDWVGPPAPGVDTVMTAELSAAGRYWLHVVDSYDNASAPGAFTLTATQQ